MARGKGAPGAQLLEIFHLQAETAQEELNVEGQGRVADRQHEAVAARPIHVIGVVIENALVKRVGEGSQGHRRAWVPGAAILDGIGSKDAHGVDRASIGLCPVVRITALDHSLQVWGQIIFRHGIKPRLTLGVNY